MEKLLNDKYDNEQRRIYITDGVFRAKTVIFLGEENRPLILGTADDANANPVYLYQPNQYFFIDRNFIVVVPDDFSDAIIAEIEAVVKVFKRAGTTFYVQREGELSWDDSFDSSFCGLSK